MGKRIFILLLISLMTSGLVIPVFAGEVINVKNSAKMIRISGKFVEDDRDTIIYEKVRIAKFTCGEQVVAWMPTNEELVTEEPVVEESAGLEPATEEPVVEESAGLEPATEEPVVEESAGLEPAKEEPATEESAELEPTSDEPVVEESAGLEPATEEPVVEESAGLESVIEEPVVEESAGLESAKEEPVVEESAGLEPAKEEPATKESAGLEPVTKESIIEVSVCGEPAVEESAAEELKVEEPVAEESSIEELAVDEPATEESAVKELMIEETENYDLLESEVPEGWICVAQQEAGEDGSYAFDGLEEGLYRLDVLVNDEWVLVSEYRLVAGQSVYSECMIDDGTVEWVEDYGILTDARTGEVVSYPEVRFVDLTTDEEYCFTGDETGRFDFRLPAGRYAVSIEYENYYSSVNDVWLGEVDQAE